MQRRCISCNHILVQDGSVIECCTEHGGLWYCDPCVPRAVQADVRAKQYSPNDDIIAVEPPAGIPIVGFTITDSGERRDFDSGSVRDSREGKGRHDLIPPMALRRLAQHYEAGAKKYADRNWEKGQPLSRYFDSAARHLNCYLEGMRTEDHLAAIAWNVFAMMFTEIMVERGKLPAELCDMPNYTEDTKDE